MQSALFLSTAYPFSRPFFFLFLSLNYCIFCPFFPLNSLSFVSLSFFFFSHFFIIFFFFLSSFCQRCSHSFHSFFSFYSFWHQIFGLYFKRVVPKVFLRDSEAQTSSSSTSSSLYMFLSFLLTSTRNIPLMPWTCLHFAQSPQGRWSDQLSLSNTCIGITCMFTLEKDVTCNVQCTFEKRTLHSFTPENICHSYMLADSYHSTIYTDK